MINKFISDIIFFVILSGAVRFLPLLVLVFLTKYFTQEQMGEIELLSATYIIVAALGMWQLDSSLQRYFRRYGGVIIVPLLVTTLVLTLIFSSIAIFLMKLFLEIESESINVILPVSLSLNAFILLSLSVRYSTESKLPLAFVNITQVLIFFMIIRSFLSNELLNTVNYFYLLSFSYLASSLLAIFYLRKSLSFGVYYDAMLTLFKYASPQMPARLISVVAQYGNRFAVLYFFGVSLLGVYSIAGKFSLVYGVFLTAFNLVWYPLVFKQESNPRDLNSVYKLTLLSVAILTPALCMFSYLLYSNFIGEEFQDGLSLSWVILYSSSFLIIKEIFDTPLKLAERPIFISFSYLIYIIVLCVLLYAFSSKFGLLGIGWAMFLSNFILVWLSHLFSRNLGDLSFNFTWFAMYALSGVIFLFALEGAFNG